MTDIAAATPAPEVGSTGWWLSFQQERSTGMAADIDIDRTGGKMATIGIDHDLNLMVEDFDRFYLDLLGETPTGRQVLEAAHQAMGDVVAKKIKRYAPVDRTPPRSEASRQYGPLSRQVTVHATSSEVVIASPFYARFQQEAAYIWAAVNDALPEAEKAFDKVIGRHLSRPGGGFLGTWGGLAAQAGQTGLHLSLGALLMRRGVVVGRFAGRLAGKGVEAAVVGPVSATYGATRLIPGAYRATRMYGAERAVLAGTRLERAVARVPLPVTGLLAGPTGAPLTGTLAGKGLVRRGIARAKRTMPDYMHLSPGKTVTAGVKRSYEGTIPRRTFQRLVDPANIHPGR